MQIGLNQVGHGFSEGSWLFRGITDVLTGGQTYAVVGPSGAGKSTFLSILAGWVEPKEGRVEREQSLTVGWVFQNPHGVAHRSASDHVALAMLARGDTPQRADASASILLARFGLTSVRNQPFAALSGGEAQRLMLARAVAADHDLLLIDEPTAQLDRGSARMVNTSLGELASHGKIVVVATHDEETREQCSRSLHIAGTEARDCA